MPTKLYNNSPFRPMEKGEWTASTLKIIAMLTMISDHVGLLLFPSILVLRWIGRLGFPLFAFFIVEGFTYTHSRSAYAGRLLLLAVLSQVPFYWLIGDPYHLNTVFTLWLSLLTIWSIESFSLYRPTFSVFSTILACSVAELLNMDYGAAGILAIVFLYLFSGKHHRTGMTLSWGSLVIGNFFTFEWLGGFAYLLIDHHYRGRRGNLPRSLWYWFYPLHLAVLHFIKIILDT